MTTFPMSNLGPQSEPWARAITDQVRQNATAIERLGGDASNDGRVNNSTMDQISAQLNEINQRQASLTTADPITTPSFGSGGSASASRDIQIPRPGDVARTGWLALSFDVSQSNSDFGATFVTVYLDGSIFYKTSVGFPTSNVTPASWGANINISAFTAFTATPTSGGLLRVEITGTASSGAARTVTASNFRATAQYSQAA